MLFSLKRLFSKSLELFVAKDLAEDSAWISLVFLSFFQLISLINVIAVAILQPKPFDAILSFFMLVITIFVIYLVKTSFFLRKRVISLLLFSLQILAIFQFYETYFPIILQNSRFFHCFEIKVLITFSLFLAETSFFSKFLAIIAQLLITILRTPTYDTPWVYLSYSFFALLLFITELKFRRLYHKCYEAHKQLKAWSLLINKVLPFGYLLIGRKLETQSLELLGCNDFMKKIFEISEKDEMLSEKILMIFHANFLKSKKTLSFLSIDDRKRTTILSFIREKLGNFVKKNEELENFDEEIIEEIHEQEVVYKEGKAKIIDIIFMKTYMNSQPAILLLITDISDKILNSKLQNLDRFKDRFLRSVSHNLKTPLNSITGLLSIIHDLVLNTEALNYLNNIRINADVLLCEINNILDYANYRKNSLKALVSQFSITSLLNELFTIFELAIYEKKIKIFRKIKLETDEILMCSDYSRIKQILFNLMNNSVKFTFKGQITVSISKPKNPVFSAFSSISAEILKFSIKDSGIGISLKDQEKLFNLWGSLEEFIEETPNSRNGAGLGLTISQHLIGLLGPEEKIYFKSKLGEGSTFFFYLYRDLNKNHVFNTNKKKIEVIPSYESSNLSLNKLTINSQFMLGSLHKGEILGNFSSYLTHPKSPLGKGSQGLNNMRNSINNGFLWKKENVSMSNFSPKAKSKRNSLKEEVFNEKDCMINQVYCEDFTKNTEKNLDEKNAEKNTEKNSEKNREKNYEKNTEKNDEKNDKNTENVDKNTYKWKINLIKTERLSPKQEEKSIEDLARNILIVDDTPFNVLVLEKFIKEIDAKTHIYKAFNGKEAVEQFIALKQQENRGFDLIFMDCNMPIMDGYEASVAIKQLISEEKLAFTPILAVTAYSGKEEEEKCLRNGMDDFMEKPINKEKFTEFYHKWTI